MKTLTLMLTHFYQVLLRGEEGVAQYRNYFFYKFLQGFFLFCFWQEPYQVKLCMTQQKSLDSFVNLDVTFILELVGS